MSRWFRFHAAAMRNPKVARLSDAQFRLWVELMAVASENEGVIPRLDDLKHILKRRLDHLSRGLQDLIRAGLMDALADGYEPHNWSKHQYKSDTSTDRVKKHRAERNVSETPPDTDTDTEDVIAKAIPSTRAKSDNFPDWLPLEAWQGFLEMRKGKGAKPTPRATGLLIAKLERLRASGHDPGAVLDQSTENNWTGIFEVKANGNQNIRNGGGNGPDKRSGLAKALDGIIAGELC